MLLCLSFLSWALLLLVLIEPKSLYKSGDGGCGVFRCAPGDVNPVELEGELGKRSNALQKAGLVAIATMSVAVLVHTAHFFGCMERVVPLIVMKCVHIVQVVMLLVFLCVLMLIFSVEFDCYNPVDLSKSACTLLDTSSLNYGVFVVASSAVVESAIILLISLRLKETNRLLNATELKHIDLL